MRSGIVSIAGYRSSSSTASSVATSSIGQISGPLTTSTGMLRRDGFVKAMAHHKLPMHIAEAHHFTRDAGARPAAELIRDVPRLTAIVAANDLLALGAFDAIRQLSLTCPQDISIVGHNDMPLVDLVSPPLTTIRIGHRAMGRDAARLLLQEIETGAHTIRHVILEPELIVRQSTATIPSP
jgi:LacI family transcriptional regulator